VLQAATAASENALKKMQQDNGAKIVAVESERDAAQLANQQKIRQLQVHACI
jgi:hypothetical protein